MQIFCVDIGAANIKYGCIQDGVFLLRGEFPTRAREGAQKVYERLAKLLGQHVVPGGCVSLCVRGRLDRDCRILFATQDIPGWTAFPLVERLTQEFGCTVFVINDAAALALGEAHFGSMRGIGDFLALNYGAGVGGALFMGGRLVLPEGDFLPEMGHIITHPDGRRCTCGCQGCYEAYASAHALTRLAASKLRRRTVTGRELCALAEQGDAVALQCLDTWAHEVALGLTSLVHVFNPRHVVLGGGLMRRPPVLSSVRAALSQTLLPALAQVELHAAQLGSAAGLYGCYVNACKKMELKQALPE